MKAQKDLSGRLELVEGDNRISLSRRVEVHDDTHLELKLDYGLPLSGSKVDYEVQIYFFFPGSLDVNELTLPKRYFYNDLRAYLRFKTPEVSLEELMGDEAADSPMTRIRTLQELLRKENQGDLEEVHDAIVEELKLYGCLARAYMRDKLARLLPFLTPRNQAHEGFYDRDRLRQSMLNFNGKARSLLEVIRELRKNYLKSEGTLDSSIIRAFAQVDEYLSSQYEKTFCRLLERADTVDDLLAEELRTVVQAGMAIELAHRESEGYLLGPKPDQPNERYTHRMRLLKKFVGSALYLELRRSIPDQKYNDWIGALAAGLAMLFATTAAFYLGAQNIGNLNSWVLTIICLIYVFKDRIKSLVKRKMKSDGLGWFPDLDSTIYDSKRKLVLGRCRETARWIKTPDVPALVNKIRSFHSFTHPDLRAATGETVLRYDKTATLFPDKIQHHHTRRGDMNDIIRISIERFRRHMDEPEVSMRTLDPETGKVLQVTGRKTYPINLVLRYKLAGQEALFEKVRVVLDKVGLERVETVIPPCAEGELEQLDRRRSVEEWLRATYL